MNEAIWYLIGDSLRVMWGALVALYIVLAMLLIIMGGERFDKWAVWKRKGVMKGIDSSADE